VRVLASRAISNLRHACRAVRPARRAAQKEARAMTPTITTGSRSGGAVARLPAPPPSPNCKPKSAASVGGVRTVRVRLPAEKSWQRIIKKGVVIHVTSSFARGVGLAAVLMLALWLVTPGHPLLSEIFWRRSSTPERQVQDRRQDGRAPKQLRRDGRFLAPQGYRQEFTDLPMTTIADFSRGRMLGLNRDAKTA